MMYSYDDGGKPILTDLLNERVAEGEAFDPPWLYYSETCLTIRIMTYLYGKHLTDRAQATVTALSYALKLK